MATLLLASSATPFFQTIYTLACERRQEGRPRLAHVITATNLTHNKKRERVQEERRQLTDTGFDVIEIDIAGMTIEQLKLAMINIDVVFVRGGNTFYLLQQVRLSSFDVVLTELLDRGVIYFGNSAGSYIVCPTIEAANWKPADRNTVGLSDLSGLNLVPFLISAHYCPEVKNAIDAEIQRCRFPVHILTDKQAILIRNQETITLTM